MTRAPVPRPAAGVYTYILRRRRKSREVCYLIGSRLGAVREADFVRHLAAFVDASVVAVSATGDHILTSDAGDIRPLVAASERSILVIPC